MYDAIGRACEVSKALQKLLKAKFSEQAISLIHALSRNARVNVEIKDNDQRVAFINTFKKKHYHPWRAKELNASTVLIFLHTMDD